MKVSILIAGITSLTLFAQAQISGTILDTEGEPIQDAYIQNIENNTHNHTGFNGQFLLETANPGDSLLISHLGYAPKYVVPSTDALEIRLKKSPVVLSEIIIAPQEPGSIILSTIDQTTNPVASSQELLETMPGLTIGQHAGGGKAEQIFLRGFDIDHGTDLRISIDGVPVNLTSHAHGQGYADLHYLIPELIQGIDFEKGPHYASQGNFATAGYINFKTADRLTTNKVTIGAGQFNSQRLFAGFNLFQSKNAGAYVATEMISTDGPFLSPQDFKRNNLYGKAFAVLPKLGRLELSLHNFSSSWFASGQIPLRAVESGLIDRFGAIDDREGGRASLTGGRLSLQSKLSNNALLENSVYIHTSEFELFSNFTFFLEDDVNGDLIVQRENRNRYGINSRFKQRFNLGSWNGLAQFGGSIRYDQVRGNELSNMISREEFQSAVQFGNVNETNTGTFGEIRLEREKFFTSIGLRYDYFLFAYRDLLAESPEWVSRNEAVFSPKFEMGYQATADVQVFIKASQGFHSNDTRLLIAGEVESALPKATGTDLGLIWRPAPGLFLQTAVWALYSEQELVYVGDAGIVEAGNPSSRYGIEFSSRYQPSQYFSFLADVNYTIARQLELPEGENLIPLAPSFSGKVSAKYWAGNGYFIGVQNRFIADRPANEDGSIVADGFFITDLNIGRVWEQWELGLQIGNLLNQEWAEAQFATESQLPGETESVEEIHFTPGNPINGQIRLSYNF